MTDGFERCPFCGEQERIDYAYTTKSTIGVWVRCDGCGAAGPIFYAIKGNGGIGGAEKLALEGWNRRMA